MRQGYTPQTDDRARHIEHSRGKAERAANDETGYFFSLVIQLRQKSRELRRGKLFPALIKANRILFRRKRRQKPFTFRAGALFRCGHPGILHQALCQAERTANSLRIPCRCGLPVRRAQFTHSENM